MSHRDVLHGFVALPIAYGGKKEGYKPVHYMYIRRHTGAGDDPARPAGRTMFVVNLPVDATRGTLREMFRKAGAVESVSIHNVHSAHRAEEDESEDEEDEDPTPLPTTSNDKRGSKAPPPVQPLPSLDPNTLLGSCSNAHIVFLDASSLDRAMQWPEKWAAKPYVWPHAGAPTMDEDEDDMPGSKPQRRRAPRETRYTGLAYLLDRYRRHRPAHEKIKQHVDSAIARYTWIREHPQWLLEQRQQGDTTSSLGVGIQAASVGPNGELLDEDGFVIVQKGNKYGRSGGDDNTFAAITPEFEEMLRQNPDKKKSKELSDFYRFQFREKKRQRTCLHDLPWQNLLRCVRNSRRTNKKWHSARRRSALSRMYTDDLHGSY